jgi:hypothetical protein
MPAVEPIGIKRVVIAGYTDYLDYFATPAEYDQQHYEGGFTMYGRASWTFVRERLLELAAALAGGVPAPAPVDYDDNQGVHVSEATYGEGEPEGKAVSQPEDAERLEHPSFAWRSGANGIDRPVDRAFVKVQRRERTKRWKTVADDLGLEIAWSSDESGAYVAYWEPSLHARKGTYRFVVKAKRYQLVSDTFRLSPSTALVPTVVDGAVELRYPEAVEDEDWTDRAAAAVGGIVNFAVGKTRVRIRHHRTARFEIPKGEDVTIPVGAARDRWGNSNGEDADL